MNIPKRSTRDGKQLGTLILCWAEQPLKEFFVIFIVVTECLSKKASLCREGKQCGRRIQRWESLNKEEEEETGKRNEHSEKSSVSKWRNELVLRA